MILTNDPSITAWGYAVVNWDGDIQTAGCIKTKPEHKKRRIRKGDDTVRRIAELNSQLIDILEAYPVEYMLSELPHGSQSASAALMIGVVTGIIQTLSDTQNIGIEWYSENDVKQCLFNRKQVTKQDMVTRIDGLYSVPWTDVKYKDEAIADALGVYHTATQRSNALQLVKMQGNKQVKIQ